MTKFNIKNIINTKSMKVTLEKIVNSRDALLTLSRERMPVVLGWKIAKVLKVLTPDLDSFFEIRNKKIKEYGKPVLDKKGVETDEYTIDHNNKETFEKFKKEIEEVTKQEIEITVPEINSNEFPENIMVKPEDLVNLEWLIKD